MIDEEARIRWNELGQQICSTTYDKNGIRIADIMEGFKSGRLVGALGMRAFFMAAFQTLLFSNTDTHIRLEVVIYTEDLDTISNVNCYKVVVDNLKRAAQLFKKDFPLKGFKTPLTRYGIFLMVKSFHTLFLLAVIALRLCRTSALFYIYFEFVIFKCLQ
jgi:hypothetical protein